MSGWLFYGPATLIALWPLAGAAIAAALLLAEAGLALRARSGRPPGYFRRPPVLCALLWLIFGLYERQIQAVKVFAADPAQAFRIDLLVLTPILYVMTAAALASLVSRWRAKD